MTLALPIRLEGIQIIDADGVMIALIRGEMSDYRERGAQIVAAVNNSRGGWELALIELEEKHAKLQVSHDALLVAAKTALYYIDDAAIYHSLKAAIAKAEKAQ